MLKAVCLQLQYTSPRILGPIPNYFAGFLNHTLRNTGVDNARKTGKMTCLALKESISSYPSHFNRPLLFPSKLQKPEILKSGH